MGVPQAGDTGATRLETRGQCGPQGNGLLFAVLPGNDGWKGRGHPSQLCLAAHPARSGF